MDELLHYKNRSALKGLPLMRKTTSPHMKNYNNFPRVSEVANQLLTCHLLYLKPWMNGNMFSFWNLNSTEVSLFLLVRCLYNKQNNTWLLGDRKFLFLCSTQYHRISHCAHGEAELKRNCTSLCAHVLFSIYYKRSGGIKSGTELIKMLSSQWSCHDNYYYPYVSTHVWYHFI